MDQFSVSWAALLKAVASLPDQAFAEPSGCSGWLVRECHLIIDAQDLLITLVTPADTGPPGNAVTYWEVTRTPPTGEDPLDAVTVRLAAAYSDPGLLNPTSTMSDRRRVGRRRSANRRSWSKPAARFSPPPTTCRHMSWRRRCTTST